MSREKMPTDIDQLIHDALHGQASDADRQLLSDWIVASEDNAKAYLRIAMDERAVRANLEREASRSLDELDDSAEATGAGMILAELAKAEALVDAPLVELIDLRTAWWQEHAGPLFAAAGVAFAALIALAVILLVQDPEPTDLVNQAAPARQAPQTDRPTRDAESPVATITATHNAKWSPPQAEGASAPGSNLSVGSPLHPNQRLTLTQGFAEITTARGAIAILEAPATVEMLDHDNAIYLHNGKIMGQCKTKDSRGFLVKTDQSDIIDLGTIFSVEVDQGGDTQLNVESGSVMIAPRGQKQGTRLFSGQTVRVADGALGPVQLKDSNLLSYTHFADVVPRDDVLATMLKQGDLESGTIEPSDTGGHLRLSEGEIYWVKFDGSSSHRLNNTQLLDNEGFVGRDGQTVYLSWLVQGEQVTPQGLGGLSLFAETHESLFVGKARDVGHYSYDYEANRKTQIDRDPLSDSVDAYPLDRTVHRFVLRIDYGDQGDRARIWIDPGMTEASSLPNASIDDLDLKFDRVRLAVARGQSEFPLDEPIGAWRFDELRIGTHWGSAVGPDK